MAGEIEKIPVVVNGRQRDVSFSFPKTLFNYTRVENTVDRFVTDPIIQKVLARIDEDCVVKILHNEKDILGLEFPDC